jgi:CheY-like chemotaxis protein
MQILMDRFRNHVGFVALFVRLQRGTNVIAASPADQPATKRATILVVEDEVLVRLMLADELRDKGYIVVEAASGDEAVSVLRGGVQADLMVTDVRMPGSIDGVAVARFVRGEYPDVKIIIVSGHMTATEASGAADEYLSKPYDLKMLIKNIKRLLEMSKGLDTVE